MGGRRRRGRWPMATMKSTLSRARWASPRSGKSAQGSAPSKTRAPTVAGLQPARGQHARGVEAPARAAPSPTPRRTSRARPRGSSRPGSRPGASPMSRAPLTLPRRRAGRNRALGSAAARPWAASATRAAVLGQRRSARPPPPRSRRRPGDGPRPAHRRRRPRGPERRRQRRRPPAPRRQTGGLAGPVAERGCGVAG